MIQSNGQNERCEDEDAVHELKKDYYVEYCVSS